MPARTIRRKIFLSLSVLTLFFGLAMVVFSQTVVRSMLVELLQEKGVAIARKVAADSVNAVITGRYFEIAMMLRDLQAVDPGFVYGYVMSEEGRVLAHTFAGGLPPGLKIEHPIEPLRPAHSRELATDQGPVLDIGVPLLHGQIGELHLGLSQSTISRDVNRIVQLILLFGAVLLFSGITSDDEIGELARVFNEMMASRQLAEQEQARLIDELRRTLGEVKTLRGFLPICSSCKKIRRDEGSWQQIESYLREHSDAEFSHGICPECAKALYPEQWEKIQGKAGAS